MNVRFFVIAAIMLAAALVCVLWPMLRSARRNGWPRAPFVLALVVAFVLPPAALGLYALLGTPRALQVSNGDNMNLATAVTQLRAKLQQQPNDREGWMLLGQAYAAMERPDDARDALSHALQLAPNDPDMMIAYAEADAQTRPNHRIDDKSHALLQRAVALQPDHQRGLWLLGISDYQRGAFDEAATHWKHLLELLQPNSKIAAAVNAQIVMAQARAQGKTQPQAEAVAQAAMPASTSSSASSASNPATTQTVALNVQVKLDPKLASRVAPGDTLFVYARAIGGPPMPLAVARLRVSDLPATVTLSDAMAMTPQLKLSMFPRAQVSARISKSGNALPQAGDLEAAPVQVATDSRKPVVLTIDHSH